MRLWIEQQTVDKSITEDGDILIESDEFYFFKRSEVSNEEGFHLEFSNKDGGFEIYMTYEEWGKITRQMNNKVLEYIKK